MVGGVVVEAADQGHLVEQAGVLGQELADLDAGDGGVDGLELAPDLLGGVGLGVVGVDVGGAAEQEDLDHGGVSRRPALSRAGLEHIGHREPGHSQGAHPEESPAGHAVAEPPLFGTEDVEHGRDPFGLDVPEERGVAVKKPDRRSQVPDWWVPLRFTHPTNTLKIND